MPRWMWGGKQSAPAFHAANCCCALLWWTRWCKKAESRATGRGCHSRRSSTLSGRKDNTATDEEQGCLVKQDAHEQEQEQLQYEADQEGVETGDSTPLTPLTSHTPDLLLPGQDPRLCLSQNGLHCNGSTVIENPTTASSADPDSAFRIRRTSSTYCCWSPGFITLRASRSKLSLNNMPFKLKLSKDSIKVKVQSLYLLYYAVSLQVKAH